MHPSILNAFAGGLLTSEEVAGKSVLEVGACDVNGSVRPIVEALGPASYLGVDAGAGPRVDRVVKADDLAATFGESAFDVVISTEMLEHVRDWQACLLNMATVLRPGGFLALTTRSPGFPYHPYPEDHWRFPVPLMADAIAALGLEAVSVEPDPDPVSPGVIVKAQKPGGWAPDTAAFADITAPGPLEVQGRPLSVLGLPHDADGSGYYRFYQPFKHFARGSTHRVMLPEAGVKFLPEDEHLPEIDVIVGQRFCGPGEALWSRWKAATRLVYETDDDVMHPDTWSGLAHWFDPGMHESFRRCVAMADMVTVTTEPLADAMRPLNPNVRVLPNFVEADLLHLDRPKRDRLVVGWSGGMSHLGDWAPVAGAIGDTLNAHPDVEMHFVGIDYSPLLRLDRAPRYTAWRPDVWSYFKQVDFDIALAPLAATPFNDCKSHIRALEAMALGIPVLASDRLPYRGMVVDGVTGYLVRTEDEWRARLTDLINDEAMRAEMGAKGREAAASWTIQSGWKLWRDAYEEVTGWQP